jgi:hypothetical protein
VRHEGASTPILRQSGNPGWQPPARTRPSVYRWVAGIPPSPIVAQEFDSIRVAGDKQSKILFSSSYGKDIENKELIARPLVRRPAFSQKASAAGEHRRASLVILDSSMRSVGIIIGKHGGKKLRLNM